MKRLYLSPTVTIETFSASDILAESPPTNDENWGPLIPLLPTSPTFE